MLFVALTNELAEFWRDSDDDDSRDSDRFYRSANENNREN